MHRSVQTMKLLTSGTIIGGMLAVYIVAADPSGQKTAPDFVAPYPIVAVPTGATEAQKAAASDIAAAMGDTGFVETDVNPVCCVWIEITGWTPNPGGGGYIIVNQPGGSIISASDVDQLRPAVERFKKSLRAHNGLVPVGLLTNYPLPAASG